jgi:hypothetical protein
MSLNSKWPMVDDAKSLLSQTLFSIPGSEDSDRLNGSLTGNAAPEGGAQVEIEWDEAISARSSMIRFHITPPMQHL